jgi:hypothetical protein
MLLAALLIDEFRIKKVQLQLDLQDCKQQAYTFIKQSRPTEKRTQTTKISNFFAHPLEYLGGEAIEGQRGWGLECAGVAAPDGDAARGDPIDFGEKRERR